MGRAAWSADSHTMKKVESSGQKETPRVFTHQNAPIECALRKQFHPTKTYSANRIVSVRQGAVIRSQKGAL